MGEYLAASPRKVFEAKEYWRLFTSSIIHADLSHFLSNSFMLSIMGYFVSYHYGPLVFPLLAFLSGILINLIVIWGYPPEVSLVGASGVVYWLWGFWLVLYFGIQRHETIIPSEFSPQVSYYAHAVGFVLGVLIGMTYFLFNRKRFFASEVWREQVNYVDEELVQEALSSDS
jgi:rhomboid protease GluP